MLPTITQIAEVRARIAHAHRLGKGVPDYERVGGHHYLVAEDPRSRGEGTTGLRQADTNFGEVRAIWGAGRHGGEVVDVVWRWRTSVVTLRRPPDLVLLDLAGWQREMDTEK